MGFKMTGFCSLTCLSIGGLSGYYFQASKKHNTSNNGPLMKVSRKNFGEFVEHLKNDSNKIPENFFNNEDTSCDRRVSKIFYEFYVESEETQNPSEPKPEQIPLLKAYCNSEDAE